MDFGLILPEVRSEPALDPQMIELQFDFRYALGKIAPNIVGPHVKPRHTVSAAF